MPQSHRNRNVIITDSTDVSVMVSSQLPTSDTYLITVSSLTGRLVTALANACCSFFFSFHWRFSIVSVMFSVQFLFFSVVLYCFWCFYGPILGVSIR